MLLEAKPLSSSPPSSGVKERPLLRQVLQPGDHDDLLEERIITYVNSLKIAANNHNKTKQEAEIYTDWANHYLEKARFKRYVQDLQVDIADGVLLADVIEAVTNEKVRNINRKPKNSTQMIENINSCLAYLAGLGVSVEGLTAKDIRDGNLKAILGLFFSLSRHKQQQKQSSSSGGGGTRTTTAPSTTPPAPTPTSAGGEMLSRLPSPFRQSGSSGKTVSSTCSTRDQSALGGNNSSNSSIPTPTATTLRKQGPQERAARAGTTSASGPAPFPSKVPSASSSRSASPGAAAQLSLIPQPTVGKGTVNARGPGADKHSTRSSGGSGVTTASNKGSNVILRPNNNTQNNNNKNNNNNANAGKNSMLDKLKFFNSKDKNDRSKAAGISKRTSSSSGFSSARSERSDSSNSLCSETKPSSSTNTSETRESSPVPSTSTSGNSSPRLVVKAFARKTFGRTGNAKDTKPTATTASPKGSRKPEGNSAKKGKDAGSKCNNNNNNNNNNNKTGVGASSAADVKADGNTKAEKLPNNVESASEENKEALQNDANQSSQQQQQQNNATNYSVILEPDNLVKQSKVSLIPKGDKGKPVPTNNKQRCASKESLASDASASKSLSVPTSVAMNTVQTNTAGGTSIPKPTAAVKGTSKVPKDDRRSVSGSTLSLNQNSISNPASTVSANLANKEVRSSGGIQTSKGNVQSKSHRVSPAKSDASTLTDPPKTTVSSHTTSGILTSSLPRTSKSDRNRGESGTVGVSIAMVSPMQAQCKDVNSSENNQQESLPCRLISGSNNDSNERTSKSNFAKVEILGSQRSSPKLSTSTHSKVETTFDSTDKVITRETTPGVPRETTFSEENEDIMVNIKPMQPIIRASPYSYMRSLGVYPARSVVPSLHVSHMGLPTSANSANAINRINIGRQLMTASPDPYHVYTCNTSQMKRHLANGSGLLDPDYVSATDPLSLAAGYMSDGDVLRADSRGDDIGSGYMSEGGASLYARRAQTRMREGMTNIKECVQKTSAFFPCDRTTGTAKPLGSFDDSSSVSSGISDTIAEISTDENLTGSSVSSDQTNPYASLKRAPKEVNLRTHNSAAAKRIISSDVNNRTGNITKSSNVKKADTAQQTENSAFRQVSSSAWKKYLLDKDPSGKISDGHNRLPQDKAELLRRGKSDLDPSKTRDKRGSGNSGVMGALRKSTTASGVALSEGIEKHNAAGSPKSKRKGNSSSNVGGNSSSGGGGGGVNRYRMSTENLSASSAEKGIRGDRISPRSSRNGTVEVQGQNRLAQGLRGVAVGSGLAYSSKRPTSTCSVSSNGSSKSTGSKVSNKRSSSDKLSELDHLETTSEATSLSSESSKGIICVSGIPRNGPASTKNDNQYLHQQQQQQYQQLQQQMACGNRGTLDRKNKIKVCSNSQTCSTDSQNHIQQQSIHNGGAVCENENGHNSLGRRFHHQQKSYTMTPLTASAFTSSSGGLREHVFGSRGALNSSPVCSDLSTVIQNPHAILGNRSSPRLSVPSSKPQDLVPPASSPSSSSSSHGILGLDHPSFGVGGGGTYPWIRHSPSAASALSRPGGGSSSGGGWLTEAESLESLASSLASSVHAHLQHARANSLTHARLLLHQRETSASPVPKLSRSNSIRSTKSEKLYPSMLQRSGDFEPYLSGSLTASTHSPVHKEREQQQHHHHQHHHSSQPTSPTPGNQTNRGYAYPVVPGSASTSGMSSCMGNVLSKLTSKEDDIHGSSLSLVSTSSSLYSSAEDKQVQEIRKLRRELYEAHDKVHNLTSQLSTNAHVVAAFEQSLSNMTCRLQALTASAERKDSELNELRSTIEALRKKSVEAGLTTAHLQSMHRSPNLVRRHTFNTSKDSALQEHRMSRQLSTDSMSSINSMSSACSAASQTSGLSQKSNDVNGLSSKKKKKKGWLRSSFSKAFSRSKKNKNGSVSDVEDLRQLQSDTSAPNSPLLNSPHMMNGQGLKISHSSSAIYDKDDETTAPEVVKELKKQLREKDMVLTDIRLEALSSAHQLESLKETVNKMRSEMVNLKHDNERLQRLVSTKSLTSSQSSLPLMESLENKFNGSESSVQSNNENMATLDIATEKDGKRVTVSVFLGCHGEYEKYMKPQDGQVIPEVLIGSLVISGKTKWDLLDSLVKRLFKEYVLRVDPVSNLGLNAESVISYHIGEIVRSKDSELPELLPFGYIIGDNMQIRITLRGTKQNSVDALAFETLIAKSIVQRYVSLLSEHRRIILCGPSGTGKTYLAHHLSEFLVLRSGKELTPGTIATFSVDHKSAKELRQYLSNVADQCESNASDLPSVIILDNLHHVGSLGEVFNGFLNAKYQKCPYIIGTMNQTTCSTTNLQLHHNFRWVLCANHMEPVKGFLGRYLRRKLVEHETHSGIRNNDLTKIIDWMPKVWQYLNKFLETHSSSDVTIGPRLFLSCPNEVAGSQVWFTDLWNYSIVPYLLEAVREGLQLYGRRAAWEDPTSWVLESYPWQPGSQPTDWPSLLQLRPEDVGYDTNTVSGNAGTKGGHTVPHELETDPLLNMLMRLQEAASYSSPHSNDSDNTSLESHNSSLQTDDVVNSSIESTL